MFGIKTDYGSADKKVSTAEWRQALTRPEPRAGGAAPTHQAAAAPDIRTTASSLRAAQVTAGAAMGAVSNGQAGQAG